MRALLLASLPCILAAQSGREIPSTQKDLQALSVTVYNEDLALVRDQREVRLPRGEASLAFQEVSALIHPETALLRNLSNPKDFWVMEQNFDFDLLTPQKLLEKYVGQKVAVLVQKPRPEGAGSTEVREEATVLATNGGTVLKFADRIETSAPGRIVFPGVPGNLRARPTLVIDLHSAAEKAQKLELTYLTGGLAWKADYVANLAPDEKSLDLSGWVTLTNKSGVAYPDATLQLVAGDVHRVQEEPMLKRAVRGAPAYASMAQPAMKEEGLFEYHLYTLDRPTTLASDQTKQVALLSAASIPVRKAFELRGERGAFQQSTGTELGEKLKVGVYVAFENRESSRMGMPLPKGTVRVYKRDSEGRAQFVGEDAMDHTPRNERVRLRLGDAFELTARRRQTDFKSLGRMGAWRTVNEMAFQIELHNAKKEAVTVTVQEPIDGDWEITQKSHDFAKETSGCAVFQVPVPPEGSATLTYRVRVRW